MNFFTSCTKRPFQFFFVLSSIVLFPLFMKAQAPVANFSADTTWGCNFVLVQFTDLSTNNPTTRLWDFGDGRTSTEANPKMSFYITGNYTVRLTVSNAQGSNTVTKTNFIKVFPKPNVNFTVPNVENCLSATIQFTDNSTPSASITSWNWDFGDGNTSSIKNPSHTYTSSGNYSVALTVTNTDGCENSLQKTSYVTINPLPQALISSNVTEGCDAPLTVNFSSAGSVGTIAEYAWNFGDGSFSTEANPIHTYTASGNYTVRLRVRTDKGCEHEVVMPDYIKINTYTAAFSSLNNTICRGQSVSFQDASSANAVSWNWDFGNGQTSNQKNPTVVYANAGGYTVILTATSAAGCVHTSTSVDYVTVHELPTVSFTADEEISCVVPFGVNFSTATTQAASWLWNFGDGTTSVLENPAHTYSSMGNYSVSLQITDIHGCTSNELKNNFIKIRTPEVQFSSNVVQGCKALEVQFSDLSTSDHVITEWLWNFGDGNVSTDMNPIHVYLDTAKYDVTLTVTDEKACANTLTIPEFIMVGQSPLSDFTASKTVECFNVPIDFTDHAEDFATNWIWDFGDGTIMSGKNPSYTYVDTGTFTVMLIAEHYGCQDTLIKDDYITILPPIARYTLSPSVICTYPDSVLFMDESVEAHEYLWTFGDGETLSIIGDTWTWSNGTIETVVDSKSPKYEYSIPGIYDTKLKVTNSNGCVDSLETSIVVTKIQADFVENVAATCQYSGVTFADNSITDIGNIVNWIWDFGDGTLPVSANSNPTHIYTSDGLYDVTLTVEDENGCSISTTKPSLVTIYKLPSLTFSVNHTKGCAPLEVLFSENSFATAPDSIVRWTWIFGDGNTLQIEENLDKTFRWIYNNVLLVADTVSKTPSHVYTSRGVYNVSLTVRDSKGCDSTLLKNNFIQVSAPYANFTVASITCFSNQVVFSNTSTNITGVATSYLWDFGDGSTSIAVSPSYQYAVSKNEYFTVSLTATDVNGCDSVLTKEILISRPEVGFFAAQTVKDCPPFIAEFQDTSSSVSTWLWNFGDPQSGSNNTSVLQNPQHRYIHPGKYNVSLSVTDVNNCTDIFNKTEYISIGGPSGSFDFSPKEGCAPLAVNFSAASLDAIEYIWIFDDGNFIIDGETVSHTYSYGNSFRPMLLLRDANNCEIPVFSDDRVVTTMVQPNFTANLTFSCFDTLVVFQDLSIATDNISSWKWNFGDGSSSDEQNPTHNYTKGVYSVSLTTTIDACEYEHEKINYISVYEMPNASFTISKNPALILEQVIFTNTTDTLSSTIHWKWDLGNEEDYAEAHQHAYYTQNGLYPIMLQAYTHEQCVDTAFAMLEISDTYYIPNAFTPNGDGINDVFMGGMNLQMIILNRWGQTLYEGKDGWNASHKGKDVSAGTYFYIITLPSGKEFKGPITVIR